MLLASTLLLLQTAAPPVQVFDAATGAAVPNAEVLGVYEAKTPLWGETWWRARWITDGEGMARLVKDDESKPAYSRLVVRAPGFATWSEEGRAGSEGIKRVELHPAIPADVRLVDFLGRPLPLVHLGFCVGCGHTPDVASVVTDRDGWATFSCVGDKDAREIADVYPVGEGVMTDYQGLSWEAAQSGGAIAIANAGRTLRGRVLLHDGSPAAGWFLSTNHRHRGPWTKVRADGSFTFHGLPAEGDTALIVAKPNGETWTDIGSSRLGVERIIRLGAEEWQAERDGPEGTFSVDVALEGGEGLPFDTLPKVEVPIEIWDPLTGWSLVHTIPPGTARSIGLTPGTYEAEVGGKGSAFPRQRLAPIVVKEGEQQELALRVPAPTFAIVSIDYEGDAQSLQVRTGSSAEFTSLKNPIVMSREVTLRTGIFSAFAVPAEDFGLWLAWKDYDKASTLLRFRRSKTRDDGVELWSAVPTASDLMQR